MLSCWIFEDEPPALRRLEQLLAGIDEPLSVDFTTDSIAGAVEALQTKQHPDLILSDIELADGLSFKIWELSNPACPVIFTTAYDQYSIKAFEVNSVDYLLKPIDANKLQASLVKYRQWHGADTSIKKLTKLLQRKQQVYRKRFVIQHRQKYIAVIVDEIAHFYSEGGLTFAVLFSGQRFVIPLTLDRITTELDAQEWFRINRAQLVSTASVKAASPYFNHRLKVSLSPDNEPLESIVSRNRVKSFLTWWAE